MAQFDILDVEWNATAFTRHVDHLIRIDEEDARVRIEKATDQPGAGDAIDFRPPPRHPNTRPPRREPFKLDFRHEGQACFSPTLIAAFHHPRVDSVRAQLRDRALAHFVAGFAGDCNRTRRIEIADPLTDFRRIAPDGARQQLCRLFVGVAPPHVDDLWRRARRDRIPEVFRGN
jgi:hypothetical protein